MPILAGVFILDRITLTHVFPFSPIVSQMRREESGFNDPKIDAALDSVTQSLTLSSRLYSPLAKALTLNNFAIISAINGDNDNARKYHGHNLKIIENDKSYKVRIAGVERKGCVDQQDVRSWRHKIGAEPSAPAPHLIVRLLGSTCRSFRPE